MTLAPTYVLLPKKIQQLAGLRLKPNRSPAKRVRFGEEGEEEQQNERALTYKISRSKRYDACSDMANNPNCDTNEPPLSLGGSLCAKGVHPPMSNELQI